jgi:hypothetical protein
MSHFLVLASQVNSVDPQSPYEHFLPGFVHAAPWAGCASGQPSVRFASHFQRGSPGGWGTPEQGMLRTHAQRPSGYVHHSP